MDYCEDPLTSGRRRVIVTSDIRNGWRDGVTILNTSYPIFFWCFILSHFDTPTHINIYNVLHLNLWHGVMPSMKRKETTRRKMTAQPTYTAAPIREMDTAQKRTFIDLDLNCSH